jgi:hypothetical protein
MLSVDAVLVGLVTILLGLLDVSRKFGKLEAQVREVGQQLERVEQGVESLPCQIDKPCPVRRVISSATSGE